ncbi:HlyD family efflux transporter periplasmic adaptor subunit [Celerinatantimonas sp. MCCC 1A17872]|uniref:HlyD family efflux transporter periplasmic adaptor subunit n=1 Tax=Celerinatantimonas sp. MCCC 1A17872 TaxID=3177514 RepID=UPI0038C30F0A
MNYHKRKFGLLFIPLMIFFIVFILWSYFFKVDQVARARGEVIASSRVQVIQSVDGGVIQSINVKEGDIVKKGEVLATLEQTRVGAAVDEIRAKLVAQRLRIIRLRAEVIGKKTVSFPDKYKKNYPDIIEVERALFYQRVEGLHSELSNLYTAKALAEKELKMVTDLKHHGDVNESELIKAKQNFNESKSNIIKKRNDYFEKARSELAKTEDDASQTEQVLTRKEQELKDSVFIAKVPGIVKNIKVTTIGGVLRAGEELMQIVPTDDQLIVEARVRPQDIARVHKGLESEIRLDPFDYTIYGSVKATVKYVSADTLKEKDGDNEEIFYRVHVIPNLSPVKTNTGHLIHIIPGMTASVSIRTGTRSLLDYLLKPLRKTISQSFGEK